MRTAQAEKNGRTTFHPVGLDWIDNPSVQRLLDIVATIIAEEYIEIARKNPEVFSDNGGKK